MTLKKIRSASFAAFALAVLFVPARPAHAWFFQEAPDKAVKIHYKLSVAAAISTNTVLIDMSDTTNWPHKETGEINIDSVDVDIDKLAASTCTVKLGVVNFVDSSTGSVTWFYGRERQKNVSNTDNVSSQNYLPAFFRCRVICGSGQADGTTPHLLSSDKTSGSTTYQNDVNLVNPAGTVGAPGPGDIILQVVNNDNTNGIVVTVDVLYHSNAR